MPILNIGVDCEQISRFRCLPYAKNRAFYEKIFTPAEIRYCVSHRDPYPRFAVRFTAKEALIKALNGIARPFFTEIEVRKGAKGQPQVRLTGKKPAKLAGLRFFTSLSHSDSHAIAFVVITDNAAEGRSIINTLASARAKGPSNAGLRA